MAASFFFCVFCRGSVLHSWRRGRVLRLHLRRLKWRKSMRHIGTESWDRIWDLTVECRLKTQQGHFLLLNIADSIIAAVRRGVEETDAAPRTPCRVSAWIPSRSVPIRGRCVRGIVPGCGLLLKLEYLTRVGVIGFFNRCRSRSMTESVGFPVYCSSNSKDAQNRWRRLFSGAARSLRNAWSSRMIPCERCLGSMDICASG